MQQDCGQHEKARTDGFLQAWMRHAAIVAIAAPALARWC